MRRCLFVLFSLNLVGLPSSGSAAFMSGADLLNHCLNGEDGSINQEQQFQDQGNCEGFIIGTWDLITTRLNGNGESLAICTGNTGVKLGDLKEKATRYLQQDSVDLQKPAHEIMNAFFLEAYPCYLDSLVECTVNFVIPFYSAVETLVNGGSVKDSPECSGKHKGSRASKKTRKAACETAEKIEISEIKSFDDFKRDSFRQVLHEACGGPSFY